MKKISTLLTAAAALAFSASAVEPVVIEIANPSFEESDETVIAEAHLKGWKIMGADAIKEDGTASFLYATQSRPKSWSDGSFGIRTGLPTDLTGANYIYQELKLQKPGVYVLQFDGRTARSNWKNDLNTYSYKKDDEGNVIETTLVQKFYDMAFIYDSYGDLENLEPGVDQENSTTILWSNGHSEPNGWFNNNWPRYYVIHKTAPETFDDDETDLTFGFGFPASTAVDADGNPLNLSKAQIACENFILRFFETDDIQVAKDWVNAEIAKIEAGEYSMTALPSKPQDPTDAEGAVKIPMHVANGTAFNIPIGTFVTNSGWEPSTGINDIVAPVVKNDKYYNLQGIEIAKPTQAGIYIHNGKKYIVR